MSDTLRRLSAIPMVGYRNLLLTLQTMREEIISYSDGGVSEHRVAETIEQTGDYQLFRWWGIGTLRGLY